MASAGNINAPNAKGETKLFQAAKSNNLEKLNELITGGADLHKGKTDNGSTPLLVAAEHGHLQIVQALLAAGADVNNGKSSNNLTPLSTASENGYLQIVQALLAAGADVNIATNDIGHTPLYVASQNGHLEIVQALLAAGADVNKGRSDRGFTPLYVATSRMKTEIMKVLLAGGADINKGRTDNGATPLFIACNLAVPEIIQILLEGGADINSPSYNGKSVLQYAEENFFKPQINELILQEFALNHNNINKPNANVFDVFMAMNSPFNNVYGDQDNIVFKVGNSFFAYPRDQIQNELDDKSGIRYICKKELHGTPLIKDVDIKNPYYLLKGPGMYMIPVRHIKKAIQKKEDRFYELVDAGEIHPFTASYTSVRAEGQYDDEGYPLNQSGNRVSLVGADHCQAGSERKVYKLKKLNIKPAAAPEGGRRRLRRKTKKAKKQRKNKSRKH